MNSSYKNIFNHAQYHFEELQKHAGALVEAVNSHVNETKIINLNNIGFYMSERTYLIFYKGTPHFLEWEISEHKGYSQKSVKTEMEKHLIYILENNGYSLSSIPSDVRKDLVVINRLFEEIFKYSPKLEVTVKDE